MFAEPGAGSYQSQASNPSAPPSLHNQPTNPAGSYPSLPAGVSTSPQVPSRPPVGGVGVLPTVPGGDRGIPCQGPGNTPSGDGLLPPPPSGDPALPSVPTDDLGGASTNDDIDFDDLTKRFEELKKKK